MVMYAKQHNKQRICKKRINESPHSQKRESRVGEFPNYLENMGENRPNYSVGEYGKYRSICPNYRENIGKYSSICPNYRENMGNIVVFAQTIGRIWEI